ncbi:MAG: ADP-ribosylation factor-like protein [Candidatus Helarchaeota archaeon]
MAEYKVVFTGLSNAGKTSILLVLDKQFHKLAKMAPTKGVERSLSTILGFPVVKWDLGGQEQYRETYLSTRPETILEADLIIYIVDIQDWDSYNEALEYYQKVLNLIEDSGEHPPIIICLHKADPEIYNKYKDHILDLMKKFDTVSSGWAPKFFITSIYNRRSIIEAFSYGISLFLPPKKSIDIILQNYMADVRENAGEKVSGVMLWDQNSIFLSMIFNDKKTEDASLTASMGLLSLIESFEESGVFENLSLDINKDYQFLVRKIGKLYTTLVGKNLDYHTVWNFYEKNYLTSLEEVLKI